MKSSAEAASLKEFSGLLEALSSTMNADRLDSIASFLHPACRGFGTASHEIFRDRKDWMTILFEEEHVQVPLGIHVQQKWAEATLIDDASVEIMAEVIFTIKQPNDKKIDIDPVRMSLLYRSVGDRMLIAHWHASYPLGEDNEETFPGSKEPRLYEEVTVLFTDFVGFSTIAATIPPKKLLSELNDIFGQFDDIMEEHGITKIKTIGDAYMAVGGLQTPHTSSHAVQAASAATEIVQYLAERNQATALKWHVRVGLHSGSIVGGVIGRNKMQFDVWGDTVNIASRLESTSEAGKINVSAYTYDLIKDHFPGKYRGRIDVKGKGEIDMYFIETV